MRWLHPWLALALLASAVAPAAEPGALLTSREAFGVEARLDGSSITVDWSIAEGYYLYRERLALGTTQPGAALGALELPAGTRKVDEFFGEQEIYRGQVRGIAPLEAPPGAGAALELAVTLQGCADVGVCFPPETRRLTVALPAATQAPSAPLSFGRPRGPSLPDADAAFQVAAFAEGPDRVRIEWQIADDVYLYRDKLAARILGEAAAARVTRIELPPGLPQVDEFFGAQEVYRRSAIATALLERSSTDAATVDLQVDFQGCADIGVCYPPMQRTLAVALPAASPATAAPAEQDRIAEMLSARRLWSLPAFFGFGLLLAFTPCVFPMIPILSSLIIGQGPSLTRGRAFLLSLTYVLAMTATYTVAGILAARMGQGVQTWFQEPAVLVTFSAAFVALALSMFGFYELQLPARWQTRLTAISNRHGGGTYIGVGTMGLLSALIVGPCVAAPMIGVLTVIASTGDTLLGGAALFAMGLGMGVPLLIIGTSAGSLLPRAGHWMGRVKAVFGVLLLGVAIWLLERLLPPAVTLALWGTLLVVSATFMGALTAPTAGAPGWRTLSKGLGLVLLVAGILLLIGAASGARDPLRPLQGLLASRAASGPAAPAGTGFITVRGIAGLDQALTEARGRPALVDVYADWCVSCKELDRYTFSDPGIRSALAELVALKADVTANDAADQALLQRYGLFGPPAILLFDAEGRELSAHRSVGFVDAESLRERLRLALGI